jgi:ubiquinone/menaquinone biosynthesis C-methylase UbiE
MNLKDLQKNWDQFGKEDPYWAIITRADKKGNKWEDEDFFRTGENRATKVVNQLKHLQPDFAFHSALDFGCGVGRVTQGFAIHFDKVIGIDIAPSMIDLANKKNKRNNCQYFLNEKDNLGRFNDEQFDFVFSVITLQHMEPKYAKNYISEFLRVLKPNGILNFQIPSKPDRITRMNHKMAGKFRSRLQNWLKSAVGHDGPFMEMYWIEIGEMINFLSNNGGAIIKVIEDDAAGKEWDSYTYFVRKSS